MTHSAPLACEAEGARDCVAAKAAAEEAAKAAAEEAASKATAKATAKAAVEAAQTVAAQKAAEAAPQKDRLLTVDPDLGPLLGCCDRCFHSVHEQEYACVLEPSHRLLPCLLP